MTSVYFKGAEIIPGNMINIPEDAILTPVRTVMGENEILYQQTAWKPNKEEIEMIVKGGVIFLQIGDGLLGQRFIMIETAILNQENELEFDESE